MISYFVNKPYPISTTILAFVRKVIMVEMQGIYNMS